MKKIVLQTIKKHKMLNQGDKIIVALSGGADSVALLSVLAGLREQWGLILYAVHVNHGLREAAHDEEHFVRELCEKWKVMLRVTTADVRAEAQQAKKGIEETGRRVRYAACNNAMRVLNANVIATGHHANDNAETVLLHLFRGAGLRGLSGISPVRGNVIRPLIEVTRVEIEAYLMKERISFINDESNKSLDYARNRVRHLILPAIEQHLNPHAAAVITRNAELLRADWAFINDQAEREIHRDVFSVDVSGSILAIPIEKLLRLHPALQNNIIREIIRRVREKKQDDHEDIHGGHINTVMYIAQGATGRCASLPGVTVRRAYDVLHFEPASAPAEKGFSYPLAIGESLFIPEMNKTITCSLSPPPKFVPTCCTHSLNYDMLHPYLSDFALRTRRRGDRITLKHKDGTFFTKKIQDYFTDAKIPRHLRDTVPLVAMGEDVAWILGTYQRTNANTRLGKMVHIYFTEESQ